MNLKTPLSALAGVGPGTIYRLKKLNLNTVYDLLYHFPFRYDDFSRTTSALEAQVGEQVNLQGEVWSIQNIYTRARKSITKVVFNDGTSPIEITWFNSPWLTKQIQSGDKLQVSGRISKYKNKISMIMPAWERLSAASGLGPQGSLHTGKLVAIYPETEGLSSKWLRTKMGNLLPKVKDMLDDPLPDEVKNGMSSLKDAIWGIHLPKNWEEAQKSKERLGFDELFYISLATRKARMDWREKPLIEPFKINQNDVKKFISSLPFKLTSAQFRVLNDILGDLSKNHPMNRLIQGEVGSGKTVISAVAAYIAFKNNLSTLFMAPTEILAFQHFETLNKLFSPFGVKIGIYTGSKKDHKDAQIIVGTHALLSDDFLTENVGLVIVDEQQRFGVEQRSLLRSKAKVPHFLTMTATPIPRTVALTLYGDLEMSIIDEMPSGRQKVKTFFVPEKKRNDSYKFIAKKVKEGDQVYIITPLIEASETLTSVKAAKVEFEHLKKIFTGIKLDLLHGRMKGAEKEKVMAEFKKGKTNILVSTSVVEVGMDNPNASIILIEGAERFGLSQLHQLRGRVGRGRKESYCLLYSTGTSPEDIRRLKLLENTYDGLKLAELDLKIRGSGQIFGTAQSGRYEFKIASFSDIALLEKTRKLADRLLASDPTLDKYPALKAKLHEMSSGAMPD